MKNKRILFLLPAIVFALVFSSCQDNIQYIFRNTYTVTFDANGGSGEMESQTFEQDKSQALSKNAFEAPSSGRVFGGWATHAYANEAEYSDNEYILVSKNMTLYALWKMDEGNGTKTVAADEKPWPTADSSFDSYIDQDVKPGDDFYAYATGTWTKNKADDDKGLVYNQDALCKAFMENILSKNIEPFATAARLFPAQDSTKLSAEKDYLKSQLAQINTYSDNESLVNAWIKALLVQSPLCHISTAVDEHKKVYFSIELDLDYYGFISGRQSKDEETEDSVFGDSNSIAFFKDVLSLDDVGLASVKNTVISFVSAWENIDKTEDKNDVLKNQMNEKVRTVLGLAQDADIKVESMLSRLVQLDLTDEEAFTLENAKTFLKYAFVHSGYKLLSGGNKYLSTMPFNYPTLMEYVKENDADGSKKQYVKQMCEEFRGKFIQRLEKNTWMSSTTKEEAIEKARNIIFYVGYPDKVWEDLLLKTPLTETYTCFIPWYEAISQKAFEAFRAIIYGSDTPVSEKIDASIVFEEVQVMANAFYSPYTNSCYLLVSNLVDPICNTDYADAYNYAVIGATTIGHEMCHAFDESGSKRDLYGRKRDWWSVSDKLHYEEKKDALSRLYSMFSIPSGTSVNGKNTLSENMADFGGLVTAYDLFVEKKIKEGYAGQELLKQKKMFFQSYAIAWTYDEDRIDFEQLIKNDSHSPYPFRTNGTVCHLDDWYELYQVERGDRYYLEPGQRIVLW